MEVPFDKQCRFVIGDPLRGGYWCPETMEKWPYCKEHHNVVWHSKVRLVPTTTGVSNGTSKRTNYNIKATS